MIQIRIADCCLLCRYNDKVKDDDHIHCSKWDVTVGNYCVCDEYISVFVAHKEKPK